jgi:hypothetical protein
VPATFSDRVPLWCCESSTMGFGALLMQSESTVGIHFEASGGEPAATPSKSSQSGKPEQPTLPLPAVPPEPTVAPEDPLPALPMAPPLAPPIAKDPAIPVLPPASLAPPPQPAPPALVELPAEPPLAPPPRGVVVVSVPPPALQALTAAMPTTDRNETNVRGMHSPGEAMWNRFQTSTRRQHGEERRAATAPN